MNLLPARYRTLAAALPLLKPITRAIGAIQPRRHTRLSTSRRIQLEILESKLMGRISHHRNELARLKLGEVRDWEDEIDAVEFHTEGKQRLHRVLTKVRRVL